MRYYCSNFKLVIITILQTNIQRSSNEFYTRGVGRCCKKTRTWTEGRVQSWWTTTDRYVYLLMFVYICTCYLQFTGIYICIYTRKLDFQLLTREWKLQSETWLSNHDDTNILSACSNGTVINQSCCCKGGPRIGRPSLRATSHQTSYIWLTCCNSRSLTFQN